MKNFKITLELGGRLPGKVSLNVQADSYDNASKLGDSLAAMMPQESYYCDKNSRVIHTNWSAYIDEVDG